MKASSSLYFIKIFRNRGTPLETKPRSYNEQKVALICRLIDYVPIYAEDMDPAELGDSHAFCCRLANSSAEPISIRYSVRTRRCPMKRKVVSFRIECSIYSYGKLQSHMNLKSKNKKATKVYFICAI